MWLDVTNRAAIGRGSALSTPVSPTAAPCTPVDGGYSLTSAAVGAGVTGEWSAPVTDRRAGDAARGFPR